VTLGAAVAGGLVGVVLLGPLGMVLGAAGAAYATTRREGKVGQTAREIGHKTYWGIANAKNRFVTMTKNRFVTMTQQHSRQEQRASFPPAAVGASVPGTGPGTAAPDVVVPAATVESRPAAGGTIAKG
jgi:hypothetical protein